MGLACRITGHKWYKLPVRNKDHDFAPSEEDGTIRCTVCGWEGSKSSIGL